MISVISVQFSELTLKFGSVSGFSTFFPATFSNLSNLTFSFSLEEGLATEKRIFYGSFATADRKEGMNAFINKRKANWVDK
jgi:enoyl-CoA hydratase/carnithine racemase